MDAVLTVTNLRESFCVFKHNEISTIGDELWSEGQCVDTQQTTKDLHMYIVGKCKIHEPKLYFIDYKVF
jgi:hypothetical protein